MADCSAYDANITITYDIKMLIETSGILLSLSPYGEHGSIAKICLQDHGVYKGFWQPRQHKLKGLSLGMGSRVMATWKAGNEDALGKFNLELMQLLPISILTHATKLLVLNAVTELVNGKVPERINIPIIYDFLNNYCYKSNPDHKILPTLATYLLFKLQLLQELGFALEIQQCCQCQIPITLPAYVSPKSGRTVCAKCATPYKSQLLALPVFLLADEPNAVLQMSICLQDIQAGFRLLQHFYQQRLEYHSFFDQLILNSL